MPISRMLFDDDTFQAGAAFLAMVHMKKAKRIEDFAAYP